MANWLMVVSEDSFNATRDKKLLGFYGDSRSQVIMHKTRVGDRIVFYITKKKIVQGLFVIASEPFLDESPLYEDERDYVWNQRIRLEPIDAKSSYDFTMLRYDLDFIKDKGISYSAYFASTLVSLSEKDFETIIEAMEIDLSKLSQDDRTLLKQ